MADVFKSMKRIVDKDVVVGKKCDICGKDIQPTSRTFPRTNVPYFDIATHHNDWGDDSDESYKEFHACSPECAVKFAAEYVSDDFAGIHSRTIEIQHRAAWFMPEEVDDNG